MAGRHADLRCVAIVDLVAPEHGTVLRQAVRGAYTKGSTIPAQQIGDQPESSILCVLKVRTAPEDSALGEAHHEVVLAAD